MFGRDQVDIVHFANTLQLHEPFGERLGRQVKAVALVRDIVILAWGAHISAVFTSGPLCHVSQNTQRRLQPEKKTLPDPLCP